MSTPADTTRVPTAILAAIVAEELKRCPTRDTINRSDGRLEVLLDRLELSRPAVTRDAWSQRLQRIMHQRQQDVSLTIADELLTGLDRNDAWHVELADYTERIAA